MTGVAKPEVSAILSRPLNNSSRNINGRNISPLSSCAHIIKSYTPTPRLPDLTQTRRR